MQGSVDKAGRPLMLGDAHEVLTMKLWMDRQHRLAKTLGSSADLHASRAQLHRTMSEQRLTPDPAYMPAASHLRGAARWEWARYAGDPKAGYDPLVGYNSRWAEKRSRKPMPFANIRSLSSSNLALATALTPLNIKPVDRRLLPKPTPPPLPQPPHRVMSMAQLAPEHPDRPAKRAGESGLSMSDSSIRELALNYN